MLRRRFSKQVDIINRWFNPSPHLQGTDCLVKPTFTYQINLGAPSARLLLSHGQQWATQEYEPVIENSHRSYRILICLIIPTLLGSGTLQVHRRDGKSEDQGDQKILHLSLWGTLNFIVTQGTAPFSIVFSEANSNTQSPLYLTKAPWRTNHLPVVCMTPCQSSEHSLRYFVA